MFTHPLKKRIIQLLDPKIDEAVQEHINFTEEEDRNFSETVNSLNAARTKKISDHEDQTLQKFGQN